MACISDKPSRRWIGYSSLTPMCVNTHPRVSTPTFDVEVMNQESASLDQKIDFQIKLNQALLIMKSWHGLAFRIVDPFWWECTSHGLFSARGGGGGGGYSSSSRAGRLGRTLWPQNSTSVAETEKGGQNSTSVWKVCKKGGQKSTILKNIGVKILQVWKWGSKFYMLKNRGQNSTMLEKRGVNILHPTPKV